VFFFVQNKKKKKNSRNGVAERMSIDHNVDNPEEAERVRKV